MDISLGIWENGYFNEIIHPTVINVVLVLAALSILLIAAGQSVKKADPSKPSKGLVLFLEVLVSGVEDLVKATMGAHNIGFAPVIGTLVLFLATANLIGLIGLTPPTSDYNVTLALALFAVFLMYFQGVKAQGFFATVKGLIFGDYPFLAPLNIIGELAKPVSLSIRLFGNILSGGIILGLIYQALGLFAPLVTWALHGYFDVFSGLIQTLIFIMLIMIWTEGISPEEESTEEATTV